MSLRDLKFEHVVRDANVNSDAWKRHFETAPLPQKKYVIFFTARSGSSWLTSVLSAENRFGRPEEFLNPGFVRDVAEAVNCKDPEFFLPSLLKKVQSPNGVFGIEVREIDVVLVGKELFFKNFDSKTTFFNLWRENIVAQAVSLYRAVETGHFHSGDGKEENAAPDYHADGLEKWIIDIAAQENANVLMLQREGRAFINLCYEHIVKSREAVLALFADALNISRPQGHTAPPAPPLKKIGDDWNDEVEKAYRKERGSVVAKIEEARLIKKLIIAQSQGRVFQPDF
jgi:LPS sulfotransferase NodH